jgi:hypothetical protein
MRALALAGAVAMCAAAGAAQGLPSVMVLLATNSAGRELHVDRASLANLPALPGARTFPVAQVRAEIRSPGGRRSGMVVERTLYSFECARRRVALLAYYRGDAAGRRSHDWRAADHAERYEDVKPGSLVETAMIYACSGGRLPVAPPPPPAEDGAREEEDGS